MEKIVRIIANNPYPIAIGWAATILGLILAIITPILQKKRKVLNYAYRTFAIVDLMDNELPDLSVEYKGRKINQLAVTRIEIWNSGNTNIDSQDMFSGHELLLKKKDGKDVDFFFSKVVFQSSDIIQCNCECRKDGTRIFFQTFETGDTVVIAVYHTGNEQTKLLLDGKMREGIIHRKMDHIRFGLRSIKYKKPTLIMALICLFSLIYSIATKSVRLAVGSAICLLINSFILLLEP